MKRLLPIALVACAAVALVPSAAPAKGLETGARNGVTVNGSPHRFVAITPHAKPKLTVVAQIDRGEGRVVRWWQVPGDYDVPAVALDGSGAGLSADEKTLVLGRFAMGNPPVYPPKRTRFAILDTELRPYSSRSPISYVDLRGHFAFDAISPDGSTLYLIRRLPRFKGPAYIVNYEVRALDLESGRLLPKPIVDPEEPDEQMAGLPLTRATSPDGRWAYTLYDGNGEEPFIHALDTVAGSAVCIDLPQLESLPRRFHYLLQLQTREGGRELVVVRRVPGPPKPRTLLTVDTGSFEVHRPEAVATASSGIGPWPPVLLLSAGAVLLLAWVGLRHRRTRTESDGRSERE